MRRTMVICDWCGEGQDGSTGYWANVVTGVSWKVPVDGTNGGEFTGELCRVCRESFQYSVKQAMKLRTPLPPSTGEKS
jgi:hypothetical protein